MPDMMLLAQILVLLLVIGAFAGVLEGLLGVGGGSFVVPMMTLCGVPNHRAIATGSGFGLVIAVPAVLGFLLVPFEVVPPLTLGAVNLVAFAAIVAVTLITALLGVRLSHASDAVLLKRVFGIFVILTALNMLRKVVGW